PRRVPGKRSSWLGPLTGSEYFSSRFPFPRRRRRRRSGGEFEARAGVVVFDRQREAVQIGDRFGDAETEPVTRRFAAALAAIEPVEYPLALLPGHAGAGVAHPQEREAAGRASLDPHPAARWRELDCVVDQV